MNGIRIDKWLWAARFYKTRALAKEAIEGGKVHHRGERCKPGKEPKVGDEYVIRTGFEERTVIVRALSVVRRGAPEAQLLYEETAESLQRREQAAEQEERAKAQAQQGWNGQRSALVDDQHVSSLTGSRLPGLGSATGD